MLRIADRWVWDSWVVDDGERYHLFFLQAPRALADPTLRHARATIGHATSRDLVAWELLPDALAPSAPGGWDDLATWTGSVVRDDDGRWRMFYTAINAGGHGLRDQRIGVALSDDLVTWDRRGTRPVVEVDARFASLVEDPEASETWRDPFVFRDADGEGWHMLITARARDAVRRDDGVIAHAWSADLDAWEVRGPLCEPGHGFGEIEVVQVREVEGRQVLVFTCHPAEQSDGRVAAWGRYSTWSVVGEHPLGPWDLARAVPLRAEPWLFAAPLVQRRDGGWSLVGFRNLEHAGIHEFEIIDPVPVHLEGGGLVADASYVANPPAPSV